MSRTTTFQPFLINALRDHHSEIYGRCHIILDPEKVTDPFIKSLEREGVITLNISHMAVRNFGIDDYGMDYDARFNGTARRLHVPLNTLLGVVDFATGALLATNSLLASIGAGVPCIVHVGTDQPGVVEEPEPTNPETSRPKGRPTLTVVK